MVNAIVHSATRVIYGLTTDSSPQLSAGFVAQEMADQIDLADGPFLLAEDGGLTLAGESAVRAAFAGTEFADELAQRVIDRGD